MKRFGKSCSPTSAAIASIPREELQRFGITFRKADYIQSAARKIISGEFDIKELHGMADAEVCNRLSALDGIGIWTAEMMMLHSLQRPDILSFGDSVPPPQNHPQAV